MTFSIDHSNPAVVSLGGDLLGGAEAMEFTGAVDELVRDGLRHLVVDLNNVELMNSSGLGMLVAAAKSLRSAGGTLVISGANDKIRNLITLTRLDSIMEQFSTREEAVAAFHGQG